ncbi:hypothetical protein INT46_004136 [Mucor plumbeus]|uniref:Uncharacterized protein n=1 Tax=Mucor plumbeus TaxID=97098 RepID=A0A8H7QLA3_9FUNG|nr:hypothetical protein INT46_004136 [Mucor plumbeus]
MLTTSLMHNNILSLSSSSSSVNNAITNTLNSSNLVFLLEPRYCTWLVFMNNKWIPFDTPNQYKLDYALGLQGTFVDIQDSHFPSDLNNHANRCLEISINYLLHTTNGIHSRHKQSADSHSPSPHLKIFTQTISTTQK